MHTVALLLHAGPVDSATALGVLAGLALLVLGLAYIISGLQKSEKEPGRREGAGRRAR